MNQVYDTYTQDPDETFQMYVERLMKAKPRFGGTFVAPPPQQPAQSQQQQRQTADNNGVGGLLSSMFPEYMPGQRERLRADLLNGNNAGDAGREDGTPSSGGVRGDFASANDVASSTATAEALSGTSRGLSQLGNALFGPVGMLLGLVPRGYSAYSGSRWDSFNAGQDSDAAVREEAAALGGLGTFSNAKGNLGTFSSPSTIAAYDRSIFGDLPTTNNVTVGGPISNPNLRGTSLNTGVGGGGDYGDFSDGAAAAAAGGYGGYW
jgi:hypothetical protein